MKRGHVFLVAALIVLVTAPSLLARVKALTIVLKWNPNQKPSMPAIDMTGGLYSLTIAPIADKRDKAKQVGENTEKRDVVPVYTNSDVPTWVAEQLTRQVKTAGFDVKSADSGQRVLKSELTEFWVNEGNLYLGSIRLKVTITDPSGKELWTSMVDGSSDNFERSLKPDNYTEAFSNAMQGLAAKLVGAPRFPQAIGKTS